ncbi:MAG: hypothetical protein DMG34_08660 [Acidobacteria bacterium]|nr:MAG: hypothetical protein DMG34_08660 [Acidobacteriota bacterium]
MLLDLKAHSERGSVSFAVRVQPRASKNEVAGLMDGALKIRLQAPAVEDRANEALCEFLAEILKRPYSAVRILAGDRSRTKRVEVFGVTTAQVEALLEHDA